ncbi:ABC transporter six-transmembrane domain-containing protein [Campylobacter concisus]|uniref:ABC transporter six-transmembrane domain-containing protein n=1 Tax=Campylobacter concisus TaxID=199 RepID=UPI00092C4A3C|nr:ABC transporter six-transmembrane domain-containing protein [Campylobacter concisus]OJJ29081.1 membrane protein [Campylobacter concisus]
MQNNAFKTLKSIATEHNKRLILTFALVLAENGLFLAYPIFAGFAINAIMQGNTSNALIYALFVLIAWLVGAIRRRVDTQVFANIYAKLAVNVIMNEKQNAKDDSAIIARVALSREFVNFFEMHFPMFFTSVISIIGSAFMLIFVEPKVAVACFAVMIVFLIFLPRYIKKNDDLYLRLNDRLEKEAKVIGVFNKSTLNRHYDVVSKFRIAISNREAMSYFIIGISASLLFLVAIIVLSSQQTNAGNIYSVMTYIWNFVISLDDSPKLIEEFSNLKDIGKRIDAEKKDNDAQQERS